MTDDAKVNTNTTPAGSYAANTELAKAESERMAAEAKWSAQPPGWGNGTPPIGPGFIVTGPAPNTEILRDILTELQRIRGILAEQRAKLGEPSL